LTTDDPLRPVRGDPTKPTTKAAELQPVLELLKALQDAIERAREIREVGEKASEQADAAEGLGSEDFARRTRALERQVHRLEMKQVYEALIRMNELLLRVLEDQGTKETK
jgi:hypothetical protein